MMLRIRQTTLPQMGKLPQMLEEDKPNLQDRLDELFIEFLTLKSVKFS